jgi:predicted nucleic acid-binding protein
MTYKPLTVVYDACVLYPFHLRNLLIQCAVDRLVEARWTNEIHEEWIQALCAKLPDIPVEKLYAARDLMNAALPNASVTGYEHFKSAITLPDPDDRHVVAAAIAASASSIITWNLRDFPAADLKKHGLQRQTPDTLLTRLYNDAPDVVIAATANARCNLTRSKISAREFIDTLRRQKLTRFVAQIESRHRDL